MYSIIALALALFVLDAATFVRAGIYVTNPRNGNACHGGQSCTVEWVDDGTSPLLPAIGVSTVGLYTGQQQLIQSIEPVDVALVRSFTFTPNPEAGPNSDSYYIYFQSVNPQLVNGTQPYTAFSASFVLDQMSGSLNSPLASATATIAVPSSISLSPSSTAAPPPITRTITISPLSTATTVTVSSSTSALISSKATPASSASFASSSSSTASSVSSSGSSPKFPSATSSGTIVSSSAFTLVSVASILTIPSSSASSTAPTTLIVPPPSSTRGFLTLTASSSASASEGTAASANKAVRSHSPFITMSLVVVAFFLL